MSLRRFTALSGFLTCTLTLLLSFHTGQALAQKKKGGGAAKEFTGMGNVKVAPGFEVALFANPPEVNYPACLAAAPTGELFVGVDQNGSLDAKAGRGKILRLVDTKGTGKADKITLFAKVDSPRGIVCDRNTVYVLHPPFLSAFHDDDGDGIADRSEVLVNGIGRDLKFRGADHTTNGIRMGIDGWIYVAVGDYGFMKATAKDGGELKFRGGGVVRVRPDGAELEVVSRGQRNIYDVAIDPFMNIFTRDNTNDGGGWDVRLNQVVQLGNYGYPTLFMNFGEEIIQPLLDTGGGSPTGALFMSEPGFPGDFGHSLLTCEWGRGAVHRHPLTPNGATFKAEQAAFLTIDRPTDIDVDGQGRLYVSSWRNGNFTFVGDNVGFIARVVPKDHNPEPFPDLLHASAGDLLKHLASASHVRRLAVQREILARHASPAASGKPEEIVRGLEKLMAVKESLAVRVAALFTYRQLLGAKSQPFLIKLTEDAAIREFALKALADRQPENVSVPTAPFEKALLDADPRVRLQALIGLARIGKKESTGAILLAMPAFADGDSLIAHIAVQALASLKPAELCLAALDQGNDKTAAAALRVLQAMHETPVVDGLLSRLNQSNANRLGIFRTLCRLYNMEADWNGKWWGTRPDTRGPYFSPVFWAETERIGEHLKKAVASATPDELLAMAADLSRHRIDAPEATAALLKLAANPAKRLAVVEVFATRKPLPSEAIALLAEVATAPRSGTPEDNAVRTKALSALYRGGTSQPALEAALRGFAMINDPSKEPAELAELYRSFVRDNSHAKRLDVFVKACESPKAAERELGLTVLMTLAGSGKIAGEKVKAAAQTAADRSMKSPETALSLLKAIRQTRAEEYAFQVLTLTKSTQPEVQKEATALVKLLSLDRPKEDRKDALKHLKYDDILASAQTEKGDAATGARLFVKQGCIACHTISKSEPPKGPYLGDVATRYKRNELIESILKPSAKIAQGFETNVFVMASGKTLTGFVVREAGDEVEIRDGAGLGFTLKKADIEERLHSKVSAMPEQLVDTLTVPELASMLAYLESLTMP